MIDNKLTEEYDDVNHPSHYTQGSIECIKAIEASMTYEEFCGYLKGCAEKYLWRYMNKGTPVKDLKKAQWYTKYLIDTIEKHDGGIKDAAN